MSIRDATIVDGPYKGWPFKAAEAFSHGATIAQVRAALVAECEAKKSEMDNRIAEIVALPEPKVAP